MDFARISRELLRNRRGAWTQAALSRKLGYRSNVLFAWESGKDVPSVESFYKLVGATGGAQSFAVLFRGETDPDLTTADGVVAFLERLVGGTKKAELCEKLGVSRHVFGRWLRGTTRVPLPAFLALVQETTHLLFDFLETLCDPADLPSIADDYARMKTVRRAALVNPWSHAIVHLLRSDNFACADRHEPSVFAGRLGISIDEVRTCLKLLEDSGQIHRDGQRWVAAEEWIIDTRSDAEATRRLASFWMELGAARVLQRGKGKFAFNTFTVSEKGYDELKELQSEFFRRMRSLIADDEGDEVAAIAAWQLYQL